MDFSRGRPQCGSRDGSPEREPGRGPVPAATGGGRDRDRRASCPSWWPRTGSAGSSICVICSIRCPSFRVSGSWTSGEVDPLGVDRPRRRSSSRGPSSRWPWTSSSSRPAASSARQRRLVGVLVLDVVADRARPAAGASGSAAKACRSARKPLSSHGARGSPRPGRGRACVAAERPAEEASRTSAARCCRTAGCRRARPARPATRSPRAAGSAPTQLMMSLNAVTRSTAGPAGRCGQRRRPPGTAPSAQALAGDVHHPAGGVDARGREAGARAAPGGCGRCRIRRPVPCPPVTPVLRGERDQARQPLAVAHRPPRRRRTPRSAAPSRSYGAIGVSFSAGRVRLEQGHAMSRPSKRSEAFHHDSNFFDGPGLDWERAARRNASARPAGWRIPTTPRTSPRRR